MSMEHLSIDLGTIPIQKKRAGQLIPLFSEKRGTISAPLAKLLLLNVITIIRRMQGNFLLRLPRVF